MLIVFCELVLVVGGGLMICELMYLLYVILGAIYDIFVKWVLLEDDFFLLVDFVECVLDIGC